MKILFPGGIKYSDGINATKTNPVVLHIHRLSPETGPLCGILDEGVSSDIYSIDDATCPRCMILATAAEAADPDNINSYTTILNNQRRFFKKDPVELLRSLGYDV